MEIHFKGLLEQDQLKELELYIEASKEYYTGDAIMSDPEFDELTEKLLSYQIMPLTEFIMNGIYRVKSADVNDLNSGSDSVDNSESVEVIGELSQNHETHEMISLDKIKWKDRSSVNEINKFFIGVKKPFCKGPKFDGAALKITFNLENKTVERIISRGGLDITETFKNHEHIKSAIQYNSRIVTGELLCPKKTFNEKYSIDATGKYAEYENARNFVGGLLKNKDLDQEIVDDLHFVALTDGINAINDNVWKPITKPEFYQLEKDIEFLKSDNFPYLCDGIVIAFNEDGERRVKNNYPLNMVAVKFPGSRTKTKVIDFDWTQKKSGNLTPVFLIEPVSLDGSTMTRANGYNYQNCLDKHIGIGSEIEIEKSGDIMPVVVKVLTKSANIKLPAVEHTRKGKHLVAVNLEESIKYRFILAMKILNIDGIGDTLAEQIGSVVEYNIFNCFNVMFKPKICEVLGGGDRWQKFKDFYNIKSLYLDVVIQMMQFNQVGPAIAKKIALLITKKSSDSRNIPDNVLTNICRGEGFKRIQETLYYLKLHGIKVLPPLEINDDVLTFEMTGNPPGMTKQEFVAKFKEIYPNSLHTALKRDTNFLFCDDTSSNTGKCNKARKYNVPIYTYTDALQNKIK